MNVETIAIEDLHENPANLRVHSPAQIEKLAAMLARFGQQSPVVVKRADDGVSGWIVHKGNGVLLAARSLGWKHLKCAVTQLVGADLVAYGISDNRAGELSSWPADGSLEATIQGLRADGFDLPVLGFDDDALAKMLEGQDWRVPGTAGGGDGAGEGGAGGGAGGNGPSGITKPEPFPDDGPAPEPTAPEIPPISRRGDVWILDSGKGHPHRVMCGNSTDAADLTRLMGGEKDVPLLCADGPYGMGKENDGVENDNLRTEKLDAFQMAWWRACRPFLAGNASAYVWGNARDLWRLWWRGGLASSERLTFRNEIVWNKGNGGRGVGTESQRCYWPSERCLFFMLGEQGFNINADNYWDGWEPIRSALMADCEKMGWGPADIERICGVGMYSHWFTKSQWAFIPEEHYKKLQAAAREHDAFKREHDELKREHDELKREHDELKREHDELKRDFYSTRAHFDNTHDAMTDVWSSPSVSGAEREGHPTPKPVNLVGRCIKSSSKDGDIVLDPFLWSGTTLVACEHLGRKCRGLDVSPRWVDVTVRRWLRLCPQAQATRESDAFVFPRTATSAAP